MLTKNRLETFSDSLIAIVITLLVLELKSPTVKYLTDKEAMTYLINYIPDFFLFFISFTVIAIMWKSHHEIFSSVKRIHSKIMWLNMVLLMFIALIPFAMTFLAKNIENRVVFIMYAGVMLAISLLFSKLVKEVKHLHKKDLSPAVLTDEEEEELKHNEKRLMRGSNYRHVGVYSYTLAILVALYNPNWAYVFLIIPLIYYFASRRLI